MHIHKMNSIKHICISPSNFLTFHSKQSKELTQNITLNISLIKRDRAETSKRKVKRARSGRGPRL